MTNAPSARSRPVNETRNAGQRRNVRAATKIRRGCGKDSKMKRTLGLIFGAVLFVVPAHRLPAPILEESPVPTEAHSKPDSIVAKHETGNSPDSSPMATPTGRASITNRGVSPGQTIATPLGRYQKMVYDAIGSKWYAYIAQRGDLITVGTARVSFTIARNGRTTNLKVIENSSNEVFANICLQSILEAKLPPLPNDVVKRLPAKGLGQEISFTIFGDSNNPPSSPSKPSETATIPPVATELIARAVDLPRVEVAVRKIKDSRSDGGEARRMEVELNISTDELLNDVRGFRIEVNKATDDTGMDLVGPRSNGREFDVIEGFKGVHNFKLELKSPHRNAVTIHELNGNVELFVPKNDPAATVVVNSLHTHLGRPIDSNILKNAQLVVVVRTAPQYAAVLKERQAQNSKVLDQKPVQKMLHSFNITDEIMRESNGIAVSSAGATQNLVVCEFRDQEDKPIQSKIRLSSYGQNGPQLERTLVYHLDARLPETTKLAILVAKPEALIKVPFTLTNVVLP